MEETTDLLQHLIRNACVNDGTVASGGEVRTVDTLMAYLQAPGVEMKHYEPGPGRGSFVLRIEGSDAAAPTLMLMGHADVVPANLFERLQALPIGVAREFDAVLHTTFAPTIVKGGTSVQRLHGHVPRQRRARGPGVAPPLHRALGADRARLRGRGLKHPVS